MTIQEVVAILQKERHYAVPSRFPCRAIMVKNISQYCELLSELEKISDIRTIQTAELFNNADVMPKYEHLKDQKYKDKWLILTGVSEYLRLFAKSEVNDRRFASLWTYQAAATNCGRIIIPLWGCEAQWFDKALNLDGDERQKDFYYDCCDNNAEEQSMNLLVLSGEFDKYIKRLECVHGDLKIGLQEWFEYWQDPNPDKTDFVLLTKRFRSVNTTNGNISVHVISDTMAFIKENMEGAEVLSKDSCSGEMQSALFEYALNGVNLDFALLNILNMSTFSGIDIMGKWKTMSESKKRFVKMWYKLHPDNTYLCHCFGKSTDTSLIPPTVLHEIFNVRAERPEWVKEYRELIQVMSVKPDSQFFHELDAIPVYETRLEFMTGTDREERIYLLHMVGKWMREDLQQVLSCQKLKDIYPELYYYLRDDGVSGNDEIRSYMSRYKSYKLENTLPADEETYFNGIQTDSYEMRYTILSENIDADTEMLWIDALGVEWLPLLYWTLSRNCDATVSQVAIGQANLPTETEFNDQWKVMNVPYVKLDKLDKLAHKGVTDEPDYYACIEDQLAFASGIYEKASELLKQHHRIIITGDHGTSRLAARFFHNRDGIDVPTNIKVYSHGRYCDAQRQGSPSFPNVRIANAPDGNKYAVFQNYDHFKQSGFAAGADDENAVYGEVHGGSTPEEMLVPIIVLDSNHEIPLTGEWEKTTVKISKRRATFTITFNKAVQQLQVKIGGINGEVSAANGGKQWNVVFSGIKADTYTPQVYANGTILTLPDVTIKPALGGGDGDFPI